MKYTVSDIKLFKKMLDSADSSEENEMAKRLHKKQHYFCSIIDQIKIDTRCLKAHRFCILFCSLALEYAERVVGENFDSFSSNLFRNTACMIAQKYPEIGKRAYTFPNRIKLHVLNNLEFDEDDSYWLMIMISTFLTIIEKLSVDSDFDY